jgi:hypothetical protein
MELMDTTLVNLKVISKLQPCVKLETDGILFQQVEWSIFPEWTRRWWYGQSRQTTISKIKQLYKSAFSIAKTDDKIAVQRVVEAMCESLAGLVHLKETYAGDNTLISQLDVVIEDINEMMKNMKGYKKVETTTSAPPVVTETPPPDSPNDKVNNSLFYSQGTYDNKSTSK